MPSGETRAPGKASKGLHPPADEVYLRIMGRSPAEHRNPLGTAKELLEFRPWMLALAVFLACALGIAVMEQFRDGGSMWAQVTAPAGR